MNKNKATLSLIIVFVLLFVFVYKRWQEPGAKEAFDRNPSQLVFTKHALCRMACRRISRADINEIIEKGIINVNRSNKNDRPCPTFAVQGNTSDGENLRVIIAQCNEATKVITCYNLKEDFECHCPGDENKN